MKHLFLICLMAVGCVVYSQDIPEEYLPSMTQMSELEKARFLAKKCWELGDSNLELATRLAEAGLEIARKHHYYHEISEISNFLGNGRLYYHSDTRAALTHFSQALEAAMKGNDTIEIGYTFNNLGDVFYLTGNIPLASAYADSAFRYFSAIGFESGLAYTYINMGQLARSTNQYEDAISYFQQAIEIHTALGIQQGVSAANLEIARTRMALKEYDEALKHYKVSLAVTRELNNAYFTANNLAGIGYVYYHLDDYPNALNYLNQSIGMYTKLNRNVNLVNSYIGKALVYSKTGLIKEGEMELDNAWALAQILNIPSKLLEVRKTRIQFYENIGDLDKTVLESHKALAVYDSLFLNQQSETLHELRDKKMLQGTLDSARFKIKWQKTTGWILGSSLFLITLLMFLLFRIYLIQQKLNKKLKTLNDSKDKLFSIIAHDLKNPLSSIIQYLELLRDNELSEESRVKHVKLLEKSTINTITLLENLLNLSAFRTGKIELDPEEFNLHHLIDELEVSLGAQLHNKKLAISRNLCQESMFADRKMIEVVIRNLVSNAIKYSHSGSAVHIGTRVDNGSYIIEIKDEGVGMNPKQVKHLFTSEFTQSNPGTSGEKGTGIGLSLCHEFIEIHGGSILVVSEENQGSTFTVRIPRNVEKLS